MGHRSNPISVRYNLVRKWDTLAPSKFNYLDDFYFKYFLLEYCFNFFYNFFFKHVSRKISNKVVKKPENYVKKILSNFFKLKYIRYVNFYKNLYVELKKILLYLIYTFRKINLNNLSIIELKNFLIIKKNLIEFLYFYYFKFYKNNTLKNFFLKWKWKRSQKFFLLKFNQKFKDFRKYSKFNFKVLKFCQNLLYYHTNSLKFFYKNFNKKIGKLYKKKFFKYNLFILKKQKKVYNLNLKKKWNFLKNSLFKRKWRVFLKNWNKYNLTKDYSTQVSYLFSLKRQLNKHLKYKRRKLLFFEFYDFLLNLQQSKIFFSFCLFEKVMGNLSLKFYFWLDYFESDFFNYIRFSQKRLRLLSNKLFYFKFDNLKFYHQNPFNSWNLKKFKKSYEANLLPKVNSKLEFYTTLKKNFDYYQGVLYYDYNFSRNGALYNIPDNLSNKILYLYTYYWNISQNFSNYFLSTYVYILYFFKKILYKNISKFFYIKNLNINFNLISFSYFNSFLFSKYLKYKFGKKMSLGRLVFSFFKLLLRVLSNVRKLKKQIKYFKFKNTIEKEQYYLMDDLVDFNGFTEILGLKVLGSGRFTKKRRVKKKFFYKQGVPLNTFHANIDYALNEKILKFGIVGFKVWVYRTNMIRNTNFNSF